MSKEEMIALLDKGPLPVLYNAIFYTLYDRGKKNVYGYNITESSSKATKIWSISSDWEYLITKSPLPKHAVTGLVLHRLTGKKGFLVWDITISVNIFLFTRSGNILITKVKSSKF